MFALAIARDFPASLLDLIVMSPKPTAEDRAPSSRKSKMGELCSAVQGNRLKVHAAM
jgi:hypothetical protein